MTYDELHEYLDLNSHCSALIKLDDNMADIYAGHTTWSMYSSMLRIYKRYDFNFKNPLVAAKSVVFSSYPGSVSSWDDYYLMSSNLFI